jgi:hypothetical protein
MIALREAGNRWINALREAENYWINALREAGNCWINALREAGNSLPLIRCIFDASVDIFYTVYPSNKRWRSVAELTGDLQGSTFYGIRSSHRTYRPSPTKDVT